MSTGHLAAACRTFSAALAAIGIDPHRVTIVLEPDDRHALANHAVAELDLDIGAAHLTSTVQVGDLTFLEWRQPSGSRMA